MNILKRRFAKYVAVGLVSACVAGVVMNGNLFTINSKASSIEKNEIVNNDNYKEFIQQFRRDGVDITITSQEELYAEFDKYDVVDKNLRDNILAATADDVLITFIGNENEKFMEIDMSVPDKSVFSDDLEENIKENYSDYITEIDTTYYERGEDSYKKVTKYSSKYGSEFEIIVEDTKEKITRNGYEKVGKPRNEVIYKDYGDWSFSYTLRTELAYMNATLGYTLSYGKIQYQYMQTEHSALAPGLKSLELQDKGYTKATAINCGEAVSAYAIYNVLLGSGFAGGVAHCHYKINMSVVKGADSNSTWKCGMSVTQKAQAYRRKW